MPVSAAERVLTGGANGHLIHHSQVFSRDGRSIVFDSRNDETQLAGSSRIGLVDLASGKEISIYEVTDPNPGGPGVGAATFSPISDDVIFIHGLDNASVSNPYAPQRRSAAIVSIPDPGKITRLDARDVSPPFTPGALRGGTHAHQWSGDGKWISFTYNDALVTAGQAAPADLRTIGVIVPGEPVRVKNAKPFEEFPGSGFAVVVVPVVRNPAVGSDEVSRAYDEGWVGNDGYLKVDGSRQSKAIAFFGNVATSTREPHREIFIADLPDDLTIAGPAGPLEGTTTDMPSPPAGVSIRRLTHADSGLQGPRHWVRVSPDGSTIAFLNEDKNGVVQIFVLSPNGGAVRQLSNFTESVDCPFNWSPDGKWLGCSAGGILRLVEASSGRDFPLTAKPLPGQQPRHGVVFSPDGSLLAFNRMLPHPGGGGWLQICLVPTDH